LSLKEDLKKKTILAIFESSQLNIKLTQICSPRKLLPSKMTEPLSLKGHLTIMTTARVSNLLVRPGHLFCQLKEKS